MSTLMRTRSYIIASDEFEGIQIEGVAPEIAQKRIWVSIGYVWTFAAVLLAVSSFFFLVATGVSKMIIPLGAIAVGCGLIGTLRVLANIEVRRRSRIKE